MREAMKASIIIIFISILSGCNNSQSQFNGQIDLHDEEAMQNLAVKLTENSVKHKVKKIYSVKLKELGDENATSSRTIILYNLRDSVVVDEQIYSVLTKDREPYYSEEIYDKKYYSFFMEELEKMDITYKAEKKGEGMKIEWDKKDNDKVKKARAAATERDLHRKGLK